MAGKIRSFSTLVENQLPEFISTDYPKFVKFVEKYYEQLETSGQPLDLINNLTKYQDIDTYEKKLLQESSILVSFVETSEIVITVQNGDSFPEKNGYVMIGEEVIFYQNRENNVFRNCYRNVSATTKLGDLYDVSEYKTVPYAEVGVSSIVYPVGSVVTNISNLFLYAFVRNFETQYLASFPEENLKPTVDKKTLIKNIKYFYQAKGTDQSIKFIFNSIVATEPDDIPSVYYPKDFTFKTSNGEWINKYALKVKVLSGNVLDIIGQRITQSPDDLDPYAIKSFAVVDNVIDLGNNFYEIILAPETIVGEFKVAAETNLTKSVTTLMAVDNIIDVFSTTGWNTPSGKLLINNELITYKSKNVNQFVIESRGQIPQAYSIGTKIYNYTSVESIYDDANGYPQTTKLIVLGVLYNLRVNNAAPYSVEGDKVQESKTGFETRDTLIYDKFTGLTRWKINETLSNPSSSLIPNVYKANIGKLNSDVSAIYEDSQYYYITSSGFPSHDFGKTSWSNLLQDQKFLKIIKKVPTVSTEIAKTPTRDVGVAVNGIPFYSCNDYNSIGNVNNDVIFGGITEVILTSKGKGYQDPPYIIVEEKIGIETATAKCILAGDVVDKVVVIDGGTGYFPPEPTITITSGRGGTAEAIVTQGKVTSLKLLNPGEYYSSPPEVQIIDSEGKGKFARYSTTISNDGKITGFIKEDEGKFYTQKNIQVKIVPVGEGATAYAFVKRWKKNRFEVLKNSIDTSNGYNFLNITESLGYGYSYVADPKALRITLGDNLNSNGTIPSTLVHSKILGYAYDGNPIYGPYGFSDPLLATSSIRRMVSSYQVNSNRSDGPPVSTYPLGFFVQDYSYNHRSGTLDENNGRYCVTPDYPEGTYAYFITISADSTPVFPYILGKTFYGVPVDSNYNKLISQNDLPKLVSRLRTDNTPDNGQDVFSVIEEVNSGSVSSLSVFNSTSTFSVGNLVEVDNKNTNGSGIVAKVQSVKGKTVTGLENRQIKAVQIQTKNTAYLFEGDILYQQNTNASGTIIGDVFDGNNIVLRNVSGNFNITDKLYSNIKVNNLIVDKSSNFTSQSILKLSNGKQVIIASVASNTLLVSSNPFVDGEPIVFSNTFSGITVDILYYVRNRTINSFQISSTPTGSIISLTTNNTPTSVATSEKCRGIILETTEDKNNIKVKITQGQFVIDSNYFLVSSTRTDTVGVKISQINKLSENIDIFKINDNIAITTTSTPHNLAENDIVDITINPDDSLTNTTYYVRKKIYQKVKLKTPKFDSTILDTGIGRLRTLNSGADYANNGSQTYTNVEIIFADQTKCRDIDGRIVGSSNTSAALGNIGGSSNARATVTVTSGLVSNVLITTKGIGYKKGDLVTFSNSSLQRSSSSISTQFFIADVDHVGFSFSETVVKLNKVEGLSENDLIKIDKEILKIVSITANQNKITVLRAQENTVALDHYNTQPVTLFKSKYNLSIGYQIGNTASSAIVKSYDPISQLLTLVYDLTLSIDTISSVGLNSTFFDESSPKKLVGVDQIIENSDYRFEFSKINNISADWIRNPIIDIQKYYKYTFDTRHPSLVGSFIEFSPSGNYNILTLETHRSIEKPGSSGSFTEIKFGFGPFYDTNNATNIKYTNYFYFDKNNIIQSDKSYLKVINDPLQGSKTITYVTPTKFVYELDKVSPYDGTGIITYDTTSISAIGEINTVLISNPGKEFKKLPIVTGIRPATSFECDATANWNPITKTIDSVNINFAGKNYSKPKVILIDGDGLFAAFSISKNTDGSINAIFVENKGKNYSYPPTIKIVETDIKAYFNSNTIGVPKTIKIIRNGVNYNRDFSISKKYSSIQILVLKNFVESAFVDGEEIVQYDGNTLIAKAVVSDNGWREGSNILRLKSVDGIFRYNLPIVGRNRNNSASILQSFSTIFDAEIKSYYNNLGYYISDRSNIGSESQRIADSYFYQDYSYTIRSKTPTDVWRNLIKNTTHPAGFKVFGEVEINTKGSAEFINTPVKISQVSFVQLWDPQKNRVTVESTRTRRIITSSIVKITDVNEVRGKGSAYVNPFDTTETISYELFLTPAFDGYIDENGNRAGTKSFTMKIKGSSSPLNVSNQNNLIISLDGIIQEPGKSFTVSDSTITFSQAPLGETVSPVSGSNVPFQKFVGKFIAFKDASLNADNFKKIKDISSQFDSVKISFPLYYEDNTPVQLPSSDNLLISIDGVIQRAGITPLLPNDRAYYIRRTTVPNEIVFDQAPRKFEEIVFSQTFNKAKQSFYGYNVGAYERLGVDEQYIDGEFKGPFILRSTFTGKTVSVDDEKNVLVFIEEVLQKRLKSYVIRGSNITFSEPLRVGQKINIVYLYGRNTVKYLTMFDFDHNDYLNLIEFDVNYNPEIKQYTDVLIYQGTNYPNSTATGYIKKFNLIKTPLDITSITASGTAITVTTSSPHNIRQNQQISVSGSLDANYNITKALIYDVNTTSFKYNVPFSPVSLSTSAVIFYITTRFTLETQNKLFVKTKDIYCVNAASAGLSDVVIPKESINNIGQISTAGGSLYFEKNEETFDILRKKTTGWLIGSSLLPNYWNALDIDDQIKIDGENEYRSIKSIPTEVIKTEYRENADATTGYLGKISTTNYNGIQLGEGLDIIANVDTDISSSTFGQVISLDWNKKDYERYNTKKILPRPAGYSYEDAPRLNFVPQSLKDEGGSIIAPAVGGGARGYVVTHNGEPIDVVLTDPGAGYISSPKVYLTRGYYVKKSNKNKVHKLITNFYVPKITGTNGLIVSSGSIVSGLTQDPTIFVESFVRARLVNRNIFITTIFQTEIFPRLTQSQLTSELAVFYFSLGKISFNNNNQTEIFFQFAPTLKKVEEESTVKSRTIKHEILVNLRSFLKLIQSPVYPGLHDTGAYLQSPLTKNDPIVYIADTSKFTISGKLMIDAEIIRYENKLTDRFYNLIRGADGTSAAIHDAGAFVRQYSENVSIVSVRIADEKAEISTISTISISSVATSIVTINQISVISDIKKTTFSIQRYYEMGIEDYYYPEPNIIFTDDILLRSGLTLILDTISTNILLRSGLFYNITIDSNPLDKYTLLNAGNYISTLESWKFTDVGTILGGGTSLQDFENNYGDLTLTEFENIRYTAYTLFGIYYNGGYPSISESGAILNTTMTTTSTSISIQQSIVGSNPLNKFPTFGYALLGQELIAYTGKTSTTLTGITRSVNGIVSTHAIGEYLRTTNLSV